VSSNRLSHHPIAEYFFLSPHSRTAFVAEIGTNGAYCLTDHLSLRGGYRLLWVDGVALVSDQLASSNFYTGNGFNGSGNVFYHGATAGLEYAF
ncbi:MAG: hypothetical protein ABI557_17065, partial [Aureliella sp.]